MQQIQQSWRLRKVVLDFKRKFEEPLSEEAMKKWRKKLNCTDCQTTRKNQKNLQEDETGPLGKNEALEKLNESLKEKWVKGFQQSVSSVWRKVKIKGWKCAIGKFKDIAKAKGKPKLEAEPREDTNY